MRVTYSGSIGLFAAATLCVNMAYAAASQTDSVSTQRPLAPFSKIVIDGNFDVDIVPATTPQVTINGPASVEANILTQVDDGELEISYKSGFSTHKSDVPTKVVVYAPSYKALTIEGNAVVTAKGIAADDLSIKVEGNVNLSLSGTVSTLAVDLEGASTLNAQALKATSVKVEVEGNTTSSYQIDGGDLAISATGNNTISYQGNPKQVTTHAEGNNSIQKQ